MKKLIVTLAFSLSAAAFGAWEKVASLQIADNQTLVQGISKVGEFAGHPEMGFLAGALIGTMPDQELLGLARPDATRVLDIYGDVGAIENLSQGDLDGFDWALIYPIAQSKAEFLAAHPGAVEKDGVIQLARVDNDALEDDDDEDADDDEEEKEPDDDPRYVAFSEDGKWVVLGDDIGQVRETLKGLKRSPDALPKNDLAKLQVTRAGIKLLEELLDKAVKELPDMDDDDAVSKEMTVKAIRYYKEMIKGAATFDFALRVSDRGIDFHGATVTIAGSELDKVGRHALTEETWKSVDPKAFLFALTAQDSGAQCVDLDAITAIFKKHGIDLKKFFSVAEPVKDHAVITVDVQSIVASCVEAAKSGNFSPKQLASLMQDVSALSIGAIGDGYKVANPAIGVSIVLKDLTPAVDARTRFANIMPEAKGKALYSCLSLSLYSTLRALVPAVAVLPSVPEEARADMKSFVQVLPAENAGGIAFCGWREQGSLAYLMRVTPDEIKSFFQAFDAVQKKVAQSVKSADDVCDDEDCDVEE